MRAAGPGPRLIPYPRRGYAWNERTVRYSLAKIAFTEPWRAWHPSRGRSGSLHTSGPARGKSVSKSTQSIRVLLVEDNPADAEILSEVLTCQTLTSFDVEWVERIRSGEERLERHPPIDVALVDLKLPDADGLEALDRIRNVDPTLPVFVMTGFDDENLANESKRRGATGYLVKGKLGSAQLCALLAGAVRDNSKRPAAATG